LSDRSQTVVPEGANESVQKPTGDSILVAEDNPVNQLLLRRFLEKLGYVADVVSDGISAVEACAKTDYAAILMDVEMPIMGGFEATTRIRHREHTAMKHTPIIAVTAHTLPGDRDRCLAAGMDDYLPKPVDLENLKAMLLRWLPVSNATQVVQVKNRDALPTQGERVL
jgi:CheY-like chemotaxis protein